MTRFIFKNIVWLDVCRKQNTVNNGTIIYSFSTLDDAIYCSRL